jgi:SNF2 family DNA or RNA helicase
MSVENVRGKLCFRFKYHPGILDAIKTVPTRKWDEKDRVHYIGKYEVQTIIDIFKSFDYEVLIMPDALALYQDVFARRELLLNVQKGLQTINTPVNLKLPLRPFQKVGHDYLVTAGKCLLCDEMGTGKTVQLISAFKTMKETGQVSKMMVLCPNSVKNAWQKDIAKFTDLKFSMVSGNYEERKAIYASEYDILVLSYDAYLMDFGMTDRNKDKEGKVKRDPLPPPPVQVLVADECQRLVRTKNKITQSLLILKEKLQLKYIYLVTGTPIVNRVEDIWSLLNFIDPEIVGEFWQFRNRYCIIEVEELKMLDPKKRKLGIFEKVVRKIPKVVGYKNLNELKVKLSPMYIRREKKEVLPDLPDKIFETMDIDLSKAQRELYEFIREDFHNRFKGEDVTVANALVWFIRAKQTCDTSELIDPGMTSSSKMEELKDLLEDLIDRGTHKVVLF